MAQWIGKKTHNSSFKIISLHLGQKFFLRFNALVLYDESNKGNSMDWTQVLTFIGVNIAIFGAMTILVIWAINKMDADVKSIGSRLDSHAQRIDQLYRMFVDLLKERK